MRTPIICGLLAILLSGCYSQRKAQNQFAKAVAYTPELAATYCALTFPIKEKIIKGKDSVIVDTLWGEGETITRTLVERVRDTVYITKYIQGNTIRETIVRTDTVVKENTAALAAARLELGKALTIATDKTNEATKWRKIAKKRFWVIAGMGAAMALGIFAMIRRKIVKKLPVG